MLTMPEIVTRAETPYFAVRRTVTLPFDDEVPAILQTLFARLEREGLAAEGPVFFKHTVVDMPRIEMEFGVPVSRVVAGEGDFVGGVLPAGRYAEITHTGPYEALIEVNGVLIDWARQAGHVFDARRVEKGEWFAHRAEIYHTEPEDVAREPPGRTTVSIKLKDA